MTINELAQRLNAGKHEAILEDRKDFYEDIKRHIENGFVYSEFTEIKGVDIALDINIDCSTTDIKFANFW